MANLARREMGIKGIAAYAQTEVVGRRETAYQQGNVVYGRFGMEAENEQVRLIENTKSLLRESVKAGILFGLKIFGSGVVGMSLVQLILEWINAPIRVIPFFAFVLLWIACAGSCFCLAGLLHNIFERILKKNNLV